MATERMPAGLFYSALIGAVSLGVLTLVGGLGSSGGQGPVPLVHAASGLCLFWGLVGWWAGRQPVGRIRSREDLLAVLQIAMMVTGILAGLVMLYAAVLEVLLRTIYFDYSFRWRVNIWSTGALDIAAIAAATYLTLRQTRDPHLITTLLWILVFLCLWLAFGLPSSRLVVSGSGSSYPVPSGWAAWATFGAALMVLIFTMAEGELRYRWRASAWPDNLARLVEPMPSWPGFHYSAGLIGVIVMLVGCIHVILPVTAVSALIMGGSLLAIVARRWNENLGDVALALITLGVVSASMLFLAYPLWTTAGIASILNRALFGLAIMVGFWHWLAGVWRQQLDNGEPWTTAGRLIRCTRRVGFLIGCLAVLISLHLSFLPNLPWVTDADNSTFRWIGALTANGLLLLSLLFSLYDTNRRTLAWLVMFTAASVIVFTLLRTPGSRLMQWWALYWPIGIALTAGLCLVLTGRIAPNAPWRALREPLIFTGVLLAPMAAIMGVSLIEQLQMPAWVPAATFGCLTGVYLLAAIWPGPTTFAAVAALCGAMGIAQLRLLFGSQTNPSIYFYLVLAGLSLLLMGLAYRGRARPVTVRFLQITGAGLALVSLVAGLLR